MSKKISDANELITENYIIQLLEFKIDSSRIEEATTWKKLQRCFNNSEQTEQSWSDIKNKKLNLNYVKSVMIDRLKKSTSNIEVDDYNDNMDIDNVNNNNNNYNNDNDDNNIVIVNDDDKNIVKRALQYEELDIEKSPPKKKIIVKKSLKYFDSDFLPEYKNDEETPQTINESVCLKIFSNYVSETETSHLISKRNK